MGGYSRFALLLLFGAAILHAQPTGFEGTWVLRQNGQNILKLTLTSQDGTIKGTLTKPSKLSINQDGDVTAIEPGEVAQPVEKTRINNGALTLSIDGDQFHMRLADGDRATLAIESFRPWKIERVPPGTQVTLATKLMEPDYPPNIRELRRNLRSMVTADQEARMAFDEKRQAEMDRKHRGFVLRIFDQYGWVTHSLAGKDAAHDFWLLVQHQEPEMQRRMLPALEQAARRNDASMSDYAYLYDRVQIGVGKPQRWGTQVKCEAGKPVLSPVEDPANLDARRKELFMMPIADYLRMDYLRQFCAKSKQ
jgi:hypothetical protein